MKIKLLCFDLDNTLIRGCNSLRLCCILNGKGDQQALIQQREDEGELDYEASDNLSAQLLQGLQLCQIREVFFTMVKPMNNIAEVVTRLHQRGILAIIMTTGPLPVAQQAQEIWGFDASFGTSYEIIDDRFTGVLLEFLPPADKAKRLNEYCISKAISPQEVMAIGDGLTDIPLFEFCGTSLALNGSPEAKEKADHCLDSDDLLDIMAFIDD